MKRILPLSLFLCLVFMLCCPLFALPAAAEQDGDWIYTAVMQKTMILIDGYHGNAPHVTIPDSIDGIPVVDIGNGAFHGRSELVSVTIPKSVKSIGHGAFEGCENLKTVKIEEGLTSIGLGAFENCKSLSGISLPDSVINLAGDAFEGTALEENLPDGLNYLGKVAYKYKGDLPENAAITIKPGTRALSPGSSGISKILFPSTFRTA